MLDAMCRDDDDDDDDGLQHTTTKNSLGNLADCSS
jgi:hypothetical protein